MERQQPPAIATDKRAADDRRVRLLSGPSRAHPIHHNAAVGGQLNDLRVDKIEARPRRRGLPLRRSLPALR